MVRRIAPLRMHAMRLNEKSGDGAGPLRTAAPNERAMSIATCHSQGDASRLAGTAMLKIGARFSVAVLMCDQ